MGTRGVFGVRIQGQDKLAYNHFDSYPEGLGESILKQIKTLFKGKNRTRALNALYDQALRIKVVSEKTTPTPTQIEELKRFADTGVSSGKLTEWYVLLHEMQGNLLAMLETGYCLGNNDFILNSLWCEWGYIVNLDTQKLEVYKGYQTKPGDKGRYNADPAKNIGVDNTYYGCALIAEIDLTQKLPRSMTKFLEPFLGDEGDE